MPKLLCLWLLHTWEWSNEWLKVSVLEGNIIHFIALIKHCGYCLAGRCINYPEWSSGEQRHINMSVKFRGTAAAC